MLNVEYRGVVAFPGIYSEAASACTTHARSCRTERELGNAVKPTEVNQAFGPQRLH
jgi:hypothetical protein